MARNRSAASERSTRTLRNGSASAQIKVRKGRGRDKKEEEHVEDISLGVRKGAALVRVGVGMTRTEHYNSVRADAQVELPSDTDPDSLRKTAAEATQIAREIMDENVIRLQEAMREGNTPAKKVEKEGDYD